MAMNERTRCLLLAALGVLFVAAVAGGYFRLRSWGVRVSQTYARNEQLWQAAGDGDVSTVKRLFAEGASPNYAASDGAFTILVMAWHSKSPATIEAVLRAHPDLTGPLIYAVKADEPDFAAFLLKHGADKNTRDYDGSTVLFIARAMRHGAVEKVLEKAGAVAIAPSVQK